MADGNRAVRRRRRRSARPCADATARVRVGREHPAARAGAATGRRLAAPTGRFPRCVPQRLRPRAGIPRPAANRRRAQRGPRHACGRRKVLLGGNNERLSARVRRRHRLSGRLCREACRRDRASRASRGRRVPRLRASRSARRLSHVEAAAALLPLARRGHSRPRARNRRRRLPRVGDPGQAAGRRARPGGSLARDRGSAPTRPVRVPSTAGSLAGRHAHISRRLHLRPCAERGPVRSRADTRDGGRPPARAVASSRLRRSCGGGHERRAPGRPPVAAAAQSADGVAAPPSYRRSGAATERHAGSAARRPHHGDGPRLRHLLRTRPARCDPRAGERRHVR